MALIQGWWALPTLRQIKAFSDLQGVISAYFSDLRGRGDLSDAPHSSKLSNQQAISFQNDTVFN